MNLALFKMLPAQLPGQMEDQLMSVFQLFQTVSLDCGQPCSGVFRLSSQPRTSPEVLCTILLKHLHTLGHKTSEYKAYMFICSTKVLTNAYTYRFSYSLHETTNAPIVDTSQIIFKYFFSKWQKTHENKQKVSFPKVVRWSRDSFP